MNSLKFVPIGIETTNKIIGSLKSKSSYGSDGLSVKLLKQIKEEVCKSITLITNQSIANMDIANATTLFNTIIYADDTTLSSNLTAFNYINDSIIS